MAGAIPSSTAHVNAIFAAALEIQEFCFLKKWRFCFIGARCALENRVLLKDWLDIDGIILRQAGKLDEGLIWRELRPLADLKQEPELLDRLKKLLKPRRS